MTRQKEGEKNWQSYRRAHCEYSNHNIKENSKLLDQPANPPEVPETVTMGFQPASNQLLGTF